MNGVGNAFLSADGEGLMAQCSDAGLTKLQRAKCQFSIKSLQRPVHRSWRKMVYRLKIFN